ncbi:MAG: DUF11 domain-containing protein [Methanoregula sp.]|nr:DUF11 domain-containing protein [Methanoregula sp.]
MKQGFCILVLCTMFLCQGAAAGNLFYEGKVVVNAIRADLNVQSTADVNIVYTLINRGQAREQVALQPAAGKGQVQNIAIEPGQKAEVVFRYTADPAGDKVRTLSLDPALLINGKPSAERVSDIAVTLKMPAGIPSLISSNKDFIADKTDAEGRTGYVWIAQDLYPTTITVKWSTLGTNLVVEKAVTPPQITAPDQECTVTLTVANRGNTAVQNVLLRDTFATSDFEGISPKEEFVMKEGNDTQQRLIWEKAIPSLPAGQNTTVQYRVRYTGQTAQVYNFRLQPTEVYAGNSLVASSERVTLHQLTGAVHVPETTKTPAPAIPLGTEVIMASLFLGAWLGRTYQKR